MKKTLSAFLLALSMLFVACLQESADERIRRQAREFTRTSCPKPMDAYTTLDSLVYDIEHRTMLYHYSLSGRMDADSIYTSEMLNVFHEDLMDNICRNTGLIELRQHGVTFRYIYVSSTTGREYMSFIFRPEDYRYR